MEHYFKQVHALEKHSAEIHDAIKNLTVQLEEKSIEVKKWKALAESHQETLNKLQNRYN